MAVATAPLPERIHAPTQAPAVRFPFNRVPTLSGPSPVVGKTQETERAGFESWGDEMEAAASDVTEGDDE